MGSFLHCSRIKVCLKGSRDSGQLHVAVYSWLPAVATVLGGGYPVGSFAHLPWQLSFAQSNRLYCLTRKIGVGCYLFQLLDVVYVAQLVGITKAWIVGLFQPPALPIVARGRCAYVLYAADVHFGAGRHVH